MARYSFHARLAACIPEKHEGVMPVLKDFVRSLERRLNRDTRRVYEYYETLKKETELAILKKARTHRR